MKPTKPNRTGKATASDTVYTKSKTAKWIVDYFDPQGSVLEPSAGRDAFFLQSLKTKKNIDVRLWTEQIFSTGQKK